MSNIKIFPTNYQNHKKIYKHPEKKFKKKETKISIIYKTFTKIIYKNTHTQAHPTYTHIHLIQI